MHIFIYLQMNFVAVSRKKCCISVIGDFFSYFLFT